MTNTYNLLQTDALLVPRRPTKALRSILAFILLLTELCTLGAFLLRFPAATGVPFAPVQRQPTSGCTTFGAAEPRTSKGHHGPERRTDPLTRRTYRASR